MSHVMHHRARYQLHLSAAKVARRGAVDLAGEWGLDSIADDLLWIVSELVSNAAQHNARSGNGQITVSYTALSSRSCREVTSNSACC